MSVYAIPAVLAFAINLTLCLIVFYDNPKGVVNWVFTLLILTFVGWNTGELIMITSDLHSIALVGVKVIFIGVFLFPVFFLHFSYVFPQKLTRFFDGWRSLILYAGPLALLVPFILLLEVDIGRVVQTGSIFYYVFTFHGLESQLLALILGLIGLGYFSWGVVNFVVSYRHTKIARQRLQILYLLVGIISMFIIGLFLHVMNYFFHLGYSFFFVASLYSLLISFFFALAIVKYRLVDNHFIIRGGILFAHLRSSAGDLCSLHQEHMRYPGPEAGDHFAPGRSRHGAGDEILALDGEAQLSDVQLRTRIAKSPGREIRLTIRRDGAEREVRVVPEDQKGQGRIGVRFVDGSVIRVPVDLAGPFRESIAHNLDIARGLYQALGSFGTRLFGERDLDAMRMFSGPIEIAPFSKMALRDGEAFLGFLTLLSLNLGIIKLMPIPVLDGGHILILTVEGVIRRNLSEKVKERVMQAGLVFLLAFFALVIVFDIRKLF